MNRTLKKIIYIGICIIVLVAVDSYVIISANMINQKYNSNLYDDTCYDEYNPVVASEIAIYLDESTPYQRCSKNTGFDADNRRLGDSSGSYRCTHNRFLYLSI